MCIFVFNSNSIFLKSTFEVLIESLWSNFTDSAIQLMYLGIYYFQSSMNTHLNEILKITSVSQYQSFYSLQ